ncbi:MAG: hypothetical protein QW835_00690 [Candidatus Hadarchaeum sp.]
MVSYAVDPLAIVGGVIREAQRAQMQEQHRRYMEEQRRLEERAEQQYLEEIRRLEMQRRAEKYKDDIEEHRRRAEELRREAYEISKGKEAQPRTQHRAQGNSSYVDVNSPFYELGATIGYILGGASFNPNIPHRRDAFGRLWFQTPEGKWMLVPERLDPMGDLIR